MALKTILNQQTDFTGEFPVEWAKSGLWRMNESAPDENNNLLDSSGAGRPAFINNWAHHRIYAERAERQLLSF